MKPCFSKNRPRTWRLQAPLSWGDRGTFSHKWQLRKRSLSSRTAHLKSCLLRYCQTLGLPHHTPVQRYRHHFWTSQAGLNDLHNRGKLTCPLLLWLRSSNGIIRRSEMSNGNSQGTKRTITWGLEETKSGHDFLKEQDGDRNKAAAVTKWTASEDKMISQTQNEVFLKASDSKLFLQCFFPIFGQLLQML